MSQVVTVTFWSGVFVAALVCAYYLMQTFDHVKPGKGWLFFITPVWFVLPRCFTEKGNYYRRRVIAVTVLLWIMLVTWMQIAY